MAFREYLESPKTSAIYQRAKEFASERHKGQMRRFSKEPYFNHPQRVAQLLERYVTGKEAKHVLSAALLHDTIEDTKTTPEQLELLFGGLVTSLVQELSSDKEEMDRIGKEEYLTKKIVTLSPWALVIKLSDRFDNITDLNKMDPEKAKAKIRETESMLDALGDNLKLNKTAQILVQKIKSKIAKLK